MKGYLSRVKRTQEPSSEGLYRLKRQFEHHKGSNYNGLKHINKCLIYPSSYIYECLNL